MLHKLRLTVAVAIVGAVLVTAPGASAHEAGSPVCDSGALCVWYDTHYTGSRFMFFGTNASWHTWAIADDDSSSKNNGTTGLRARIWQNTSYGGTLIECLAQGVKVAHNDPNDEGSSNDWQWSC